MRQKGGLPGPPRCVLSVYFSWYFFVPYRTPPACAKRATYPDPPPVILLPESIAAQAAYQLRYENTEYYSWVSSGPKCFQVLGLSPSLL